MENISCLLKNFPWDLFLFLLGLGLLLWWLLSSLIGGRLKSHAAELQDRINFLEGELEACRKSKVTATVEAPKVSADAGISAGAAGVAAGVVVAVVLADRVIRWRALGLPSTGGAASAA